MKVKKFAKLFQAGSYDDKGIEVKAEDLDLIAKNFKAIPIKVEHTDTVFDGKMGSVTGVFADNGTLYGALEFDEDIWKALNKIEANKLSIGLKKDLSGLTEVSVVKKPRVADARVFSFSADLDVMEETDEEINFLSSFNDLRKGLEKALGADGQIKDFGTDWLVYRAADTEDLNKCAFRIDEAGKVIFGVPKKVKVEYVEDTAPETVIPYGKEENKMDNKDVIFAENEELRKQNKELADKVEALMFAQKENAVDARLGALVAEGKITPAGKEIAKAIMMSGKETVDFSGKSENVVDLFVKFVDSMPKAENAGKIEVLPDESAKDETADFSDDDMKLIKGLGADPERVRKIMGGSK